MLDASQMNPDDVLSEAGFTLISTEIAWMEVEHLRGSRACISKRCVS
jgi:hypothetical protein